MNLTVVKKNLLPFVHLTDKLTEIIICSTFQFANSKKKEKTFLFFVKDLVHVDAVSFREFFAVKLKLHLLNLVFWSNPGQTQIVEHLSIAVRFQVEVLGFAIF